MTMDEGRGRPEDDGAEHDQPGEAPDAATREWYFDLPSGAWERQEEKNRELRQRVQSNLNAEPQRPDPFVLNRPPPEPKSSAGLFGFGKKKSQPSNEPKQTILGTFQLDPAHAALEEQTGVSGDDVDEWTTEPDVPLRPRLFGHDADAQPPHAPPVYREAEASSGSLWGDIFGASDEEECGLAAMKSWAASGKSRPAAGSFELHGHHEGDMDEAPHDGANDDPRATTAAGSEAFPETNVEPLYEDGAGVEATDLPAANWSWSDHSQPASAPAIEATDGDPEAGPDGGSDAWFDERPPAGQDFVQPQEYAPADEVPDGDMPVAPPKEYATAEGSPDGELPGAPAEPAYEHIPLRPVRPPEPAPEAAAEDREDSAQASPTRWDEMFEGATEVSNIEAMREWLSKPLFAAPTEEPADAPEELLQPFDWEQEAVEEHSSPGELARRFAWKQPEPGPHGLPATPPVASESPLEADGGAGWEPIDLAAIADARAAARAIPPDWELAGPAGDKSDAAEAGMPAQQQSMSDGDWAGDRGLMQASDENPGDTSIGRGGADANSEAAPAVPGIALASTAGFAADVGPSGPDNDGSSDSQPGASPPTAAEAAAPEERRGIIRKLFGRKKQGVPVASSTRELAASVAWLEPTGTEGGSRTLTPPGGNAGDWRSVNGEAARASEGWEPEPLDGERTASTPAFEGGWPTPPKSDMDGTTGRSDHIDAGVPAVADGSWKPTRLEDASDVREDAPALESPGWEDAWSPEPFDEPLNLDGAVLSGVPGATTDAVEGADSALTASTDAPPPTAEQTEAETADGPDLVAPEWQAEADTYTVPEAGLAAPMGMDLPSNAAAATFGEDAPAQQTVPLLETVAADVRDAELPAEAPSARTMPTDESSQAMDSEPGRDAATASIEPMGVPNQVDEDPWEAVEQVEAAEAAAAEVTEDAAVVDRDNEHDDPWASFAASRAVDEHDSSLATPGGASAAEPAAFDVHADAAAGQALAPTSEASNSWQDIGELGGFAPPVTTNAFDWAPVDTGADASDLTLDLAASLDSQVAEAEPGESTEQPSRTVYPTAGRPLPGFGRRPTPLDGPQYAERGAPRVAEEKPADEGDVVLRAFERHAATPDREQEPDEPPVPLETLLGEQAEKLVDESDPDAGVQSFARLQGWAPQRAIPARDPNDAPWEPERGGVGVGPEPESFVGEDEDLPPPWATDAAGEGEPFGETVAAAKKSRSRTLVRELVETGLLAILVFLAVRASFQNFKVDGTSMYPTLHNGQFLIVNKLVYSQVNTKKLNTFLPFISAGSGTANVFHGPQRGDIVVLVDPQKPSTDLIKRVIGLPGDTVQVVEGHVYINDHLLVEPYIKTPWHGSQPKITIPAGEYFVMGDNRDNSLDSRSPQVGLIPKDNIIGKAMLSYWPSDQFGFAPNGSPTLSPTQLVPANAAANSSR